MLKPELNSQKEVIGNIQSVTAVFLYDFLRGVILQIVQDSVKRFGLLKSTKSLRYTSAKLEGFLLVETRNVATFSQSKTLPH